MAAALNGSRVGSTVATVVLALFWAGAGIAYYWLAFAAINRAAWLFGALFVVEAPLLLWFGIARGQLRCAFRSGLNGIVGLLFVAYAAIVYPLFGMAAGHSYPAMATFGITSCPVTIFKLGLFLLARRLP